MAATVMGHYSSDTRDMSPDAAPEQYPGRPIRPLPKRRLRERLSPDVADSIVYPPTAPNIAPLFYYPYSTAATDGDRSQRQYPADRPREDDVEHNYISRRNVKEIDSDEDYVELAYRSRYSRHSPDPSGRSYRYVQKPEAAKYPKPDPPASTTSSADGYDSFENTNNKKKRKIPTPGDAISNGILLSNDLASLGISGPTDDSPVREDVGNGAGQYYGSPISGTSQGLSGPGRGRYGRVSSGRSPLRTLSDAPNNWSNGRTSKQRQPAWPSSEPAGIISTAIANAGNNPTAPSGGQENMSLLQEQAARKANPAAAQFTFTCDSQVPGTVAWPSRPQPPPQSMNQNQSTRPMGTHATQTSPSLSNGSARQPQGLDSSQHAPKQNGRQGGAPGKKNRRPTGKEYLIAARQRREQQELQNYHHPPAPEDEWICEFCEYERIFGTPPEALIRQYEMKDRRIRKQEAERRRLLEKAKMKGRKSKKNGKAGAKHAAAATHGQTTGRHGSAAPSHTPQGTSETYYDDDEGYDEEYAHDEHPPSPTLPLATLGQQGGNHNFDAKHAVVQGGAGSSEALVS